MVLDDEKKKEIGKRIQKTRKELGFKNGHAFYDFVFGDGEIKTDNKKDSVISEWENGKKYIDLDHLMLAADKLGVSLDYLVYGKGEEEHAPTLREICENVARFFFLAKAEMAQTNDCIEMKIYKRDLNSFLSIDNNEFKEGIGEDLIKAYIRRFCKDLIMAKKIDDNEQYYSNLDGGSEMGKSIPLRQPMEKDIKVGDLAWGENFSVFYGIPAALLDSPFTIEGREYLNKALNKIPDTTPLSLCVDYVEGLIKFREGRGAMEKAPPE